MPGLSGAEPFLCCGGRVYEDMDFDIDLNNVLSFPGVSRQSLQACDL